MAVVALAALVTFLWLLYSTPRNTAKGGGDGDKSGGEDRGCGEGWTRHDGMMPSRVANTQPGETPEGCVRPQDCAINAEACQTSLQNTGGSPSNEKWSFVAFREVAATDGTCNTSCVRCDTPVDTSKQDRFFETNQDKWCLRSSVPHDDSATTFTNYIKAFSVLNSCDITCITEA